MTAKEILEYLVSDAGLSEAEAKQVMELAKNDKINQKALALKQAKEFEELNSRAEALRISLEGADGKGGSKAYQKWYEENFPKVQDVLKREARYRERYGDLDAPDKPNAADQKTFTLEDVKKVVAEAVLENEKTYGPKVVALATNVATITEKHIRAGRKNPIDWKKIDELAATTGGDPLRAYDEWDRPEREANDKALRDKEIEDKVKERLATERSKALFPAAAAESSSSPFARRSGDDGKPPAYDRRKVLETAITGKLPEAVQ